MGRWEGGGFFLPREHKIAQACILDNYISIMIKYVLILPVAIILTTHYTNSHLSAIIKNSS